MFQTINADIYQKGKRIHQEVPKKKQYLNIQRKLYLNNDPRNLTVQEEIGNDENGKQEKMENTFYESPPKPSKG